jgi:hypothetical protein
MLSARYLALLVIPPIPIASADTFAVALAEASSIQASNTVLSADTLAPQLTEASAFQVFNTVLSLDAFALVLADVTSLLLARLTSAESLAVRVTDVGTPIATAAQDRQAVWGPIRLVELDQP